MLQLSAVHGLLSLQFFAVPAMHVPLAQVSLTVQAFPSSHVVPVSGVWTQPLLVLHVSVVQTLLSSQSTVVPLHVPPAHVSFVVHAFPSSHAAVLSTWTHWWESGSHVPKVLAKPFLHVTDVALDGTNAYWLTRGAGATPGAVWKAPLK